MNEKPKQVNCWITPAAGTQMGDLEIKLNEWNLTPYRNVNNGEILYATLTQEQITTLSEEGHYVGYDRYYGPAATRYNGENKKGDA